MLRDIGVSLQFFSALTGIEATKLSYGFRQIKAFSSQDSLKISRTLFRLIEVRSALEPLQISTTNPEHARRVLKALEGMSADEIRERVSLLFDVLKVDV